MMAYKELIHSLQQLGHNDMAKLILDYSATRTITENVLFRLGIDPEYMKNTVRLISLPLLYHIRIDQDNVSWRSLEELDKIFPLTTTLHPRIPSVDANREDSDTPRVCLAQSIKGAAGSIDLNKISTSYVSIYITNNPIEIVVPFNDKDVDRPRDNKFYVHDAGKWGEVWSLRPVRMERLTIVAPGYNIY